VSGTSSWPFGREVVAKLRALPRDELPAVIEILRLADNLPRHAISRRVLRGQIAAAEAILAGVHPGKAAADWDALVETLTGPPVELAAANLIAGIEDDLAGEPC